MNSTDETQLFFTEEDKLLIAEMFNNDELQKTMLNSKNKKVFKAKFKQTISKYNKAIDKLNALKRQNSDERIGILIAKFEKEKHFMLNTFGFLFKE